MTEPKKTAQERLRELNDSEDEHLAEIALAAAKVAAKGGRYTLQLTDPIQVGGESVSELSFRPPKMADMEDSHDDKATLAASLCGITPAEFKTVSLTDFQAVDWVMQGFRMRRVAGFPAQSKKS